MKDDLPIFTSAKRWLDHYFNGDDPMIDFQLLPQGSNFQQEVWNELTTIKYGDLKTYGILRK